MMRDTPAATAGQGRMRWAVLCLLTGLAWSTAAQGVRPPERPGPPQQSVSDRIGEAHQAIQSARIDVRYTPYFSYPDEAEFLSIDYQIAFDRASKRIRIDRPGYTLISDGTDLLLVADDLPGRHLRVPLNGPLTYERLLEVLPDLADPLPPAVILLLADPPMPWLSAGFSQEAKSFVPKHAGDDFRRGMRFAVQLGRAEVLYETQSLRIDEMIIHVDDKQLVGSGIDAVRFHYDVDWVMVDKPIDEALFELDLEGTEETTTLAQFLAAPANPGPGNGGAGGGPAGGGGGTLIGLPLPDIELDLLGADEALNLSELDEGVVIVEFFATWTRPSVLDLPALADFKAWCEEEGHAVAIYTVAVGEKSKAMAKWMDALEKTAEREIDLPVLLDESTDAAMALRLPTVPRTLVVVDGKIAQVFGGVKPEFLEDLKQGLPGWLEQVEADQSK